MYGLLVVFSQKDFPRVVFTLMCGILGRWSSSYMVFTHMCGLFARWSSSVCVVFSQGDLPNMWSSPACLIFLMRGINPYPWFSRSILIRRYFPYVVFTHMHGFLVIFSQGNLHHASSSCMHGLIVVFLQSDLPHVWSSPVICYRYTFNLIFN